MKDFRLSTGMNQNDFAEYFGISVRTLQEWEQGRRKPPEYIMEMMKKLWIAEKAERIVESMSKLSNEEFAAATKLYDHMDMDIVNMTDDMNNDYLTICEARNGRKVVWYMDSTRDEAMYIDDGQILDAHEIEKELC